MRADVRIPKVVVEYDARECLDGGRPHPTPDRARATPDGELPRKDLRQAGMLCMFGTAPPRVLDASADRDTRQAPRGARGQCPRPSARSLAATPTRRGSQPRVDRG